MRKNISYVGIAIFSLFLIYFATSKEKRGKKTPFKKEVSFGIDVSQYQGEISWQTVKSQKNHPIEFVLVRATMGESRKDKAFERNFKQAKKHGFIVGAYHYYDPDENSLRQVNNYLSSVRLQKGDFIPIVDIEELSKIQSKQNLLLGLRRWLTAVEKHYGVKPIIYTGHSFFKNYLLKQFSDYPLWIAAYSKERRDDQLVANAEIHQFSEKIRVKGIRENSVDGNDVKRSKLAELLIK